jgi:hypothetical protein
MDAPSLGGFGVYGCFAGRVVDVFAAGVFADFGQPSVGMFLK